MSALAKKLAALKAEVNTGGTEKIVTLGNGNHTLKLRMPKDRVWCAVDENSDDDFFEQYTVDFSGIPNPKYENNGPKTYYAVPAVVVESTNADIADDSRIQYIRFAPSMVNALIGKLTLWEDLFQEIGNVITVSISQKGKWNCDIEVHPTKKFDSSKCSYPDTSIEDAAKWAAGDAKDKQTGDSEITAFA